MSRQESGPAHMRTLGVRLGHSMDDAKKAYKAKALQFHPDRNGGQCVEQFKAVQAAWEYISKNPSVLTTPSFSSGVSSSSSSGPSRTSTGGYSYSYPSSAPSSSEPKASTPIFTEAELFGDMSDFGDFGKKRSTMKSSVHPNGRPRANVPEGFRQPSAKNPLEQDSMDQIQRDRERMQANPRVPLQPTKTTEEILRDIRRQHHEFASMGEGTRSPPAPRDTSGKPTMASSSSGAPSASYQQDTEKAFASTYRTSSGLPSSPEESPPRPPRRASSYANQTSNRKMYDNDKGRKEYTDEAFAQAREEAQRKLDAANVMDEMERSERKKRIDEETKKEWESLLREMHAEKEKTVISDAIDEAKKRSEQEAEADRLLRSISADRRRLKADELSRQLPSTANISAMPEGDLLLFQTLLEARLDVVRAEVSKRARGPCAVCQTSARDPRSMFSCHHTPVCELCFIAAIECPVCGKPKR